MTSGKPLNIIRAAYNFLSSAKLALALLIAILASCVIGVTVVREERAWTLIFSTLWFNALLVMLVLNVGFCFFGRIWGRRLTLISFGMILFHLSFISIFAGIVYSSLFYFKGTLRLTEGETLPNGQMESYDTVDQGRFFNASRLKGETTLINMQTHYKTGGVDKGVVSQIAAGEGEAKKQGFVFITKNFDYNGFRYFRDKEGYSVLVFVYDNRGRELYGAYVALQSLKQKEKDTYFYTTGSKDGPGSFAFPQDPMKPLFGLQVVYSPDPLKERAGSVFFQVWPLHTNDPQALQAGAAIAEGKAAIGQKFAAGDYYLSVKEVRYWSAMSVRHDPGLPIVLASLWVGLGGMVITTVGRLRRDGSDGRSA